MKMNWRKLLNEPVQCLKYPEGASRNFRTALYFAVVRCQAKIPVGSFAHIQVGGDVFTLTHKRSGWFELSDKI